MTRLMYALLFISSINCKVLQVPLQWRESIRYRHLRQGLGYSPQNVTDYNDNEYFGKISIGTPPQEFYLIFDTASADVTLPGPVCTNSDGTVPRKYVPEKSSTFKKDGRIYSNFFNNITLAMDTLALGGNQEITIKETSIGMTEKIFGPKIIVDGVIGFAFTAAAHLNTVPPLINAINQNALDQGLFSVFLEKRGSRSDGIGGQFTFGAIDTVNCGSIIAYEQLAAAYYWQYKTSKVSLGSYSSQQDYVVMSSTSTSFILGPKAITEAIGKAAGSMGTIDDTGLLAIDCNAKPSTLDFTIGNNIYSIKPENYIIEPVAGHCYLTLLGLENSGFGPSWILGDVFIRQYCHVFDISRQRIGFAQPIRKTNQ